MNEIFFKYQRKTKIRNITQIINSTEWMLLTEQNTEDFINRDNK